MALAQEIESRLRDTYAPDYLEVIDESEMHRGHAGYQEGGESHWRIVISAQPFEGKSRLARHRAVHDGIGKDIIARIHALAIEFR